MEAFATYIKDSYKKKLMDKKVDKPWNSMASGNLYKSVHTNVKVDGRDAELTIDLADYWKELEEGQPVGTIVTTEAILNWIRVKHIIPEERNGHIPTESQLAYLIKRKIEREGTEPTFYMQYTIDEALDIFEVRLVDALQDDFTNAADEAIKTSFGGKISITG